MTRLGPNADATSWSFTLRDGITWQDGKEITCADVKYGVERSFSSLFSVAQPYAKVNGTWVVYGMGNAVVALIFSIAKREVTFLSGTAAISRL